MKIFSWNVNGIRAAQKKGFLDFVNKYNPDILCLQETKAEPSQLDDGLINISGYSSYFESCKIKKGYSGVAIYSKLIPINQSCSLGSDKIFDVEFSEPIRGVASGQSAVFYDKNICLGGGIISKSA